MINELNAESKAVGLNMNQLKTKVMFNQYSNQQNITLDAAKLEPANKFFDLGQTITMTPDKEIEI